MSTEKQISANRANSLLSCGPKSDAGREASSLNHLNHGLSGAFHLLKSEDPEAFAKLLTGFRDEHQPATVTEDILVEKMAEHHWLTKRALRFQANCFDEETGRIDQPQLHLLIRYQTTHERAFARALRDLLALRKDKRAAEIGFESQERKQAAEQRHKETHEQRLVVLKNDAERDSIGLHKQKVEAEKVAKLFQSLDEMYWNKPK